MKIFHKIIVACIAVTMTVRGIADAESFSDFWNGFMATVLVIWAIVVALGDD